MRGRVARKITKALILGHYRNWRKSTRLKAINRDATRYWSILVVIARRKVENG